MVVGVCDKARGMSGQQAAVKLPWVKRVTEKRRALSTRTLAKHARSTNTALNARANSQLQAMRALRSLPKA